MSTSITDTSSSRAAKRTFLIVWLLVLAIGAFFVVSTIPRYLTLTANDYGPHYWPRAAVLLPHLLGGLVAIVIGPFQFWAHLRNSHPKIHRVSGRVYLISVTVGALAGLVMAVTSEIGLAYASGLGSLGIAWLATSGMAFVAIRRRNFVQHKQWMIRSYVVTFAFVTFRVVDGVLSFYEIGEDPVRWSVLAWACWAVPLLIAELVIQGRQVVAK